MAKGLTINGNNGDNNIVGSNNDDVITVGNGDNLIAGLAGNDIITAGNGDNTISDGDGNDTITVGNGNNTITAGNGNDTVTAGNHANNITVGNGNDKITVGNGNNTIVAGNGADNIQAGNGNDFITVGSGNDTITVGNGNDTILAGAGNDVIKAGNGNDFINSGGGSDQVFAGNGNDTFVYNMFKSAGATDFFDGGKGTDTLQLELTHAEFASAAVQADLAAFSAFLAQNVDSHSDKGPTFQFHAFDLSVANFETLNVVLVNAPVVITSGPESASVAELPNTTGSNTIDTTATIPAGTLNFTDTDTGDTHTVAVSFASDTWSGGTNIPAATQADLASALTTILHDSTGTGSGSIDWNFGLPDHDFDFLAAGETLTINYNVSVSDASTTSTQTVSVVVTGANDLPVITSGPETATIAELPNTTGSSTLDTTADTLAFTDPDLTDAHHVSVALNSAVWSANSNFAPAQTEADLQTALTTALHDSTGSGSGSIGWTFALPDHDLDFLSPNETLTASYNVTVSDAFSSSTQTVTVIMDGAADPIVINPFMAAVTDAATPEAGTVVSAGSLFAGDVVPDLSDTLSVTSVNGSAANLDTLIAGTFGTLIVDGSGSYAYIANPNLDALQAGQTATDQFTFTVTDTEGNVVPTTLTFDITGADHPAVITGGITSGEVTENAGPTEIINGGFETGDLTGWTETGTNIQALFLALGGAFGNFSAELPAGGVVGTDTLSQNVATTAGQHYIVSFDVTGDADSTNNTFIANWDGAQILSVSNVQSGAFTHYSFDVVGDPSASTTPLQFTYSDDGTAMFLDNVSVSPETAPAIETTNGNISFTSVQTANTHTASFAPEGNNYLGTFSLDPVNEVRGRGDRQLALLGGQFGDPVPRAGSDAHSGLPGLGDRQSRPLRSAGRHRHDQRRQRTADRRERNRRHRCRPERHGRHPGMGAGGQRHRSGYDGPHFRQQHPVQHRRQRGTVRRRCFLHRQRYVGRRVHLQLDRRLRGQRQYGHRNRDQQRDVDHGTRRRARRQHPDRLPGRRIADRRLRQQHPDRQFRQPCHDRRRHQRHLRLPAHHRRPGHHHRFQQRHREGPYRGVRQRLRRRADGRHGRDAGVRDVGRQPVRSGQFSVPLRYRKPDALLQRRRNDGA